jgi:hypothetical protein
MTRIALAGASYPYSISVRRGALHDWAYFLCVCAYLNHSGTNALIKIHVSTRHLIEEASCMTCQRSCTCLNASHSGTNTPFSKSICGHNIEWDTNFFTRAIRLGTSRFDPAGYALGMHARLRLAEEAILSAAPCIEASGRSHASTCWCCASTRARCSMRGLLRPRSWVASNRRMCGRTRCILSTAP